ncbi:MAG: nickel-dependent lactate racemase [Candidatus Bathyarchaeia archaeon]
MNTLAVSFPFGNSRVSVKLPKRNLRVLVPQDPPALRDEDQEIQKVLLKPIKSSFIREIVSPQNRVVLLVSDITRPVPNRKVVPPILRELRKASVSKDKITIIVATGMHRSNTRAELKLMLGEEVLRKVRVVNHNAFDEESLVYVGKTSRNTPLSINKLVFDADVKILTGYIEPHEFAGFTGGRKSILPGVSGINTIDRNHSPAMLFHPKARIGVLRGNPIHEDMVEAAKMVGVDFILNVVLNSENKIVKVVAGDLIKAHLAGVKFYEKYGKVEIDEPADIVIASSGYPLDINLYQSVKSLVTAEAFVKENGVIILLAECIEGVGHHSFLECLKHSTSPADMLKNIEKMVEKNVHIAELDHCYLLARILRKCKVIVVSPNPLVREINENLIATAKSPMAALNMALRLTGEDSSIVALPHATRTIPK